MRSAERGPAATAARVRVRASVQQQRGDSEAAIRAYAGKEQGVPTISILRTEAGPTDKQAPSELDVVPLRSMVQQRVAIDISSGEQALVLVHCCQHCSRLPSTSLLQERLERPLAQARPRPRRRRPGPARPAQALLLLLLLHLRPSLSASDRAACQPASLLVPG